MMGIVGRFLASLAVAAVAASAPLSAHHWLNAGYDPEKTFTLNGVVTRYEWKNPHVVFHVDVMDDTTRQPVRWVMEMGSPNGMQKLGWSKSSLRAGERVTVHGRPMRNGTLMGYPHAVILVESGRRFVAADPAQ
jgi:hypothetical protein